MAYLLDTNILSELRKTGRGDPGVAGWAATVAPTDLFLSALALGEIRRGIELLRPRDPATARHLEQWLQALEIHYSDRVLPVTAAIADRWGRLSPGQPLPVVDGLMAATALEHSLTLVTRNTGDFTRSGVRTLNPFSGN